ncbi:MAG: helix-turn-helix domain-containing protein [Clostridia bacterium]|nr:helix-turn-helix domain-containing protein [Clostridia bacterium]
MDELKDTIAKNLIQLRTQAHLTQLQLAEKLNYSDKAVSKWERGEAIPDVRVLVQLARLYNISVDDIINTSAAAAVQKAEKGRRNVNKKRLMITLLSIGLVWFVATVVFMIFYFIPATANHAWLAFIFAPFACGVVLTVFSVKWGNWITNILSCSLIIWSLAVIFHIFVMTFTDFNKMYFLYIVAGVFEILVILWFTLRRMMNKRKKV